MQKKIQMILTMLLALLLGAGPIGANAASAPVAVNGQIYASEGMGNGLLEAVQDQTQRAANDNRRRRPQTAPDSSWNEGEESGADFSNQPLVGSDDDRLEGQQETQNDTQGPPVGDWLMEPFSDNLNQVNPFAADGNGEPNESFSYNMGQFVTNSDYGLFVLSNGNHPVSLNGHSFIVGEKYKLSFIFRVEDPVNPNHSYEYKLPSVLAGLSRASEVSLSQNGEVIARLHADGDRVLAEFTEFAAERVRAGQSFVLRYDFVETLNETLAREPGQMSVRISTSSGYDTFRITIIINESGPPEGNGQANGEPQLGGDGESGGDEKETLAAQTGGDDQLSLDGQTILNQQPASGYQPAGDGQTGSVGQAVLDGRIAWEDQFAMDAQTDMNGQPSLGNDHAGDDEPAGGGLADDGDPAGGDDLFDGNESTGGDEPADGYQPTNDGQPAEGDPSEDESGQSPHGEIIVERFMEDIIRKGNCFVMKATLNGLDGVEYFAQWQYDAGDGWRDVEGANSLILSVVANEFNVNYGWRILVRPIETFPGDEIDSIAPEP